MINDHANALLLRRDGAARTPCRRLLLNLRFQCQRLRAIWIAGGTAFVKRSIDVVFSFVLLILCAPLFLLVAMLVKIEDGGPIFFAQRRVGQHGREFRMYKIRSMCLDAERRLEELLARNQHKDGVTFKLRSDPRITRVGRILRKFSLDELPQLYNVLRGDMSLVGPRPPVPSEVSRYSLAHRRRLA
ncbi:MAG TPA: sugar transferase, partial [Verrucomicrobiota bacterium]|nr:sugar transferase [Verrucomicrobiota bacterium]